jgi:hypothetical protein
MSFDVSTQPQPGQQTKSLPASRLQYPPIFPGPQLGEPLQVPLVQVWPCGQAMEQAPQFWGSLARYPQASGKQHTPTVPSAAKQSSLCVAALQLLPTHAPLTQRVYWGQLCTQPPGGSGSRHAPYLQIPEGHETPQSPQFPGSR